MIVLTAARVFVAFSKKGCIGDAASRYDLTKESGTYRQAVNVARPFNLENDCSGNGIIK